MNNSVFNFSYSWARFHGIVGNIKRIPRMFKWAYQRVIRGYADCDVWDFDCFLANIIPAALRQLAEGYSYPHEFNTPEEWSKWLIETAELFEQAYEGDFLCIKEEWEERQQKLNIAFDRLKEYFGNLWD